MLQKLFLSALLLFSANLLFGQGSIHGVVKDAKSGESIIGANVIIEGTQKGTTTNVDGSFVLDKLVAGSYTLQVSFITYKTHIVPNVIVENAKKTSIDISLSEDVTELQEVVVQGSRQMDTDFELLRAIKESKLVVSGVTAEQISKTLDRDAAQVLRRVPGVTIKDNQFVQVRGLSERYNPVMLHDVYAPSLETDIRSFSFSMLPSSQLDRMMIFKSPSADLPGDFAGGVVKVYTKSIPDENGLIIDYSTQLRAGTTFNDYYHQDKNAKHLTGFNDGFYDLPSWFPSTLNGASSEKANNVGSRLRTSLWNQKKGTAIPDQRFSITSNRRFNIGRVNVGNVTALNYSNSYTIFNIERGDFASSVGADNQAMTNRVSTAFDNQYNQQVRLGALFNWAFKLNDNNKIQLKNLFNQISNDQFVDRQANSTSPGRSFDKSYRTIYSGQLVGTHALFSQRTSIDWTAGYNNSSRQQPDYKRYFYSPDGTGRESIVIPGTPNPNFLGRFYGDLTETSYSGGIALKQSFGFTKDALKNPEIKVGAFFENKERTFAARNIGYIGYNISDSEFSYQTISQLLASQNFKSGGMAFAEDSKKKDSYTASNNLLAYYAMLSVPFSSKLKLDAGARIEDNLQKLNSYDDFNNAPVKPSWHVNRILPSANLSYNFTEKMLIRGAYGETLNRPEFRELAPFTFYDFNFNMLYAGDPNLKTAKIHNVDLRWELYPSKAESISFGVFYKNFTDPLENVIKPVGGVVKEVTFLNAKNAESYGVELEIKKSLNDLTSSNVLNKVNFLFNATAIKSRVKLSPEQSKEMSSSRPLQGQAPYVINTALFYNDDQAGWQVNLLYNVVGKHIFYVGNNYFKDVYLMPRNVIDLTVSKTLSERWTIKGGISDILNQPYLLMQDGNEDNKVKRNDDNVIQKNRMGQLFSLGFSWRVY